MKNARALKKAGNSEDKNTPGPIRRMTRILACLNKNIDTITGTARKIKDTGHLTSYILLDI